MLLFEHHNLTLEPALEPALEKENICADVVIPGDDNWKN